MKPVIAFSPADEKNMPLFEKMRNSLRKFHSEEELPLKLIGPGELARISDPMKFYRMTPMIAKDLLDDYETVIKLDADQIITGKLNHVWEQADYDVACVQNSNPREFKSYPVSVWDINPLLYLNCGFVAMRNKKFVDHWWDLCTSDHFNNYQMREQDLLNIMCFYGDYKVRLLDMSKCWHGLISKGFWNLIELRGDKLILPKNEQWPRDEDKEIVCIHIAGGNVNKDNLGIYFRPEVLRRLTWLTSASSVKSKQQ